MKNRTDGDIAANLNEKPVKLVAKSREELPDMPASVEAERLTGSALASR